MPQRFIVRYRGKGPRPEAGADRIAALKSARVIDDTSRMMLVEGAEDEIRSAFPAGDWLVTPEVAIDNPVDLPRVKKGVGE